MLRVTFIPFLSKQWRAHSEQLKKWLATTDGEVSVFMQSRNYLGNLRIGEDVIDLDDSIELLHIIAKNQYPHSTQLVVNLKGLIHTKASEISTHHLKDAEAFLSETPSSVDLWCRTFFESARTSGKLIDLIETTSIFESISFASSLWMPMKMFKGESSFEARKIGLNLSTVLAKRIEALLMDSPKGNGISAFDIIKISLELNVPIECDFLSPMCNSLRIAAMKLKENELRDAILLLEGQHDIRTKSKWYSIFQDVVISKSFKSSNICLRIFAGSLNTSTVLDSNFLDSFSQIVKKMNSQELLNLFKLSDRDNQGELGTLNAKLTRAIEKRLANILMTDLPASNEERALNILLCTYVNQEKAKQCFDDFARKDLLLTTQLSKDAVDIMLRLGHFPPDLIAKCQHFFIENITSFSREESARLLYAVVSSGVIPDVQLIEQSISFGKSRKFSRRNNKQELTIDSLPGFCLCLMIKISPNVSCHYSTFPDKVTMLLRASIEKEVEFTLSQKIEILTWLTSQKASTEVAVLLPEILYRFDDLNVSDSLSVLRALVLLNSRDTPAFSRILRHISHLEPSVDELCDVVSSARKLKLLSNLQKSEILNKFPEGATCTVSKLLLILSACNTEQKKNIIKKVGNEWRNVDPEGLPTHDLFFLLVQAKDEKEAFQIALKIRSRKPIDAQILIAEDILCAAERWSGNSDILLAVCQTGCDVLLSANESEFMRLYESVRQLPHVPNTVFRVVGKLIHHFSDSISADNALLWLALYTEKCVRDDGVGRILLKRISCKAVWRTEREQEMVKNSTSFFGFDSTKRIKSQKKKKTLRFLSDHSPF